MSILPALSYIPLEIEENIIDQLDGDVRSLRSCALACREWNQHVRVLLIASICVRSREDLYSIFDYIISNPRMASFVRSLTMSPAVEENTRQSVLEILPVDLLKQLPNLQRYSIVDDPSYNPFKISFHATTLIHMKIYLLVEELQLGRLEFRTGAELARLLMSLPRLRRLQCGAKGKENMLAVGTGTARFRDKCRELTEVTVSESADVHTIRLLVEMSLSRLTVLRFHLEHCGGRNALDLSKLTNLRVLAFFASSDSIQSTFDRISSYIAALTKNTLRDLTISFVKSLPSHLQTSTGHTLEDTVLALGGLHVVVSMQWVDLKRNKSPFWSNIIHSHLPRLHKSGSLQFQCCSEILGHDTPVSIMATSPDAQFIATAAEDGTVIIWGGTTAPERILMEMHSPEKTQPVLSLLFCDTGKFLAAMCKHDLLIWRVADGVQITSIPLDGCRHSCAWRRHDPSSLTLCVLEYGLHKLPRKRKYRGMPTYVPLFRYLSVTTAHVDDSGMVTISTPASLELPNNVPVEAWSTLDSDPKDESQYERFIVQSSSGLCFAAWEISTSGCYIGRKIDSNPAYNMHQLHFGFPYSVPSCASFVDDTQLVAGFADGTFRWWDISSSPATTWQPRGILSLFPQGTTTSSLTVSPLHSFIITLADKDMYPAKLDMYPALSFRGAEDRSDLAVPSLQDLNAVPVLRRTNCPHLSPTRMDHDYVLHTVLRGHTLPVNAACFSPCDRYVATASSDRTVRLWSTRNGELLWTFDDHGTDVKHVAFSPDGRTLASADCSGRVCIRLLAMVPPLTILRR